MIISAFTTSAFAVTYTLSCWHSDDTYVGYLKYDGSIYKVNYSTDSTYTSSYNSAISNAISGWNSALPISVSEQTVYYALQTAYGGTRAQLITVFPSLAIGDTGMSVRGSTLTTYSASYAGIVRMIHQYDAGGKFCVVQNTTSNANNYKNTALHELGHIIGWRGHSSNSTHVMYDTVSSVTSLTTADKKHVTQVYSLFH